MGLPRKVSLQPSLVYLEFVVFMDAFTIMKDNFSVESITLKILPIFQFLISNNISKILRKEGNKCLHISEVRSKL